LQKRADARAEMTEKEKFLQIYTAAHVNAEQLLSDAEVLFERGSHATAYFLAFTALEEISKSQLAADVYTGISDEEEFRDVFTKHHKKIRRMAWASNDAWRYLDSETETYLEIQEPTVKRRMSAIYVECDRPTVESPDEVITAEMAKSLIHIVRVALHRIFEMIEYYGHQIGTKGFMK
jgi:AbiV family abortive infection protein